MRNQIVLTPRDGEQAWIARRLDGLVVWTSIGGGEDDKTGAIRNAEQQICDCSP
jgi:hypothetical protein